MCKAAVMLCAAGMLLLRHSAAAQVPSQTDKVRIAVWALRDAYPALQTKEGQEAETAADAGEWDYPRAEIRRVAKFMVGGMVRGWSFDYTPSDKRRQVKEYFEITSGTDSTEATETDAQNADGGDDKAGETGESGDGLSDEQMAELLGLDIKGIDYTQVWVEGGKVWCWIEFVRTESMKRELALWQKLDYKTATGVGYGSITEGFDGLVMAAREAVKDAVREKYRALTKNKPRRITGRVLVRNPPRIGISSGRYKVALDFFVETDTMEAYNVF